MARATAAEQQQMDKKTVQVRVALDRADAETALYRYLPSLLLTGPQEAALKNLTVARQRYETWADATHGWRRWANDGQEPDGHPYPVSFWLRIGDDISAEVGLHVMAADQGTTAGVAVAAVTGAPLLVKPKAPREEPWPLKWKLAVAGVAVLAGAGVLTGLLRQVNTLTGKEA